MDGEFVLFECDFFPKHGRIIITESAENTAWTRTNKHTHTGTHNLSHLSTHTFIILEKLVPAVFLETRFSFWSFWL